jgi:hypothetical protein
MTRAFLASAGALAAAAFWTAAPAGQAPPATRKADWLADGGDPQRTDERPCPSPRPLPVR